MTAPNTRVGLFTLAEPTALVNMSAAVALYSIVTPVIALVLIPPFALPGLAVHYAIGIRECVGWCSDCRSALSRSLPGSV